MTLAERTARARWPGCESRYEPETLGIFVQQLEMGCRKWNPEHSEKDAAELIEEAKITVWWRPSDSAWYAHASDADESVSNLDRKTAICLAYLGRKEKT